LCSYGEKSSGTKHVHGNRKFKLNEDLTGGRIKLGKLLCEFKFAGNLTKSIKNQLQLIYNHQVNDDIALTYKIDGQTIYISYDLKSNIEDPLKETT